MKTRNKQTYQEHLADMAEIKVTCAKCGRKDARLSPMGVLCLTCTFEKPGKELKWQEKKYITSPKIRFVHLSIKSPEFRYAPLVVEFVKKTVIKNGNKTRLNVNKGLFKRE